MQLRHIRPRSVDWYDANFEDERRFELSPEEKSKLRRLGQVEVSEMDLKAMQHGPQIQHSVRMLF
jgi:hypothetical protein